MSVLQREELATMWRFGHDPETEHVASIGGLGTPFVLAGREYDDTDYRRGSMFYWGIYLEGMFMPATITGWSRTPENARRAAERAMVAHDANAWL